MSMPGFTAELSVPHTAAGYQLTTGPGAVAEDLIVPQSVTTVEPFNGRDVTPQMSFSSPISSLLFKGCCFCTENYGCICYYPCPLPGLAAA